MLCAFAPFHSFTPAFLAGRSRPVRWTGLLLFSMGVASPLKLGATEMLPFSEMYSPIPVLSSKNASTPKRCVLSVMSASLYFRAARSNACDHFKSFSFASFPFSSCPVTLVARMLANRPTTRSDKQRNRTRTEYDIVKPREGRTPQSATYLVGFY